MEIDLASAGTELLPDPGVLRTQVCIVGGGIAGLVLADKLVGLGVDVVLLESGGRGVQPGAAGQAAGVELTGEPHTGSVEGRPSGLGGSSAVWGGQLLPMLPASSWPIPAADLERYAPEIERLMSVDDLPFAAEAFLAQRPQQSASRLPPVPRLVARMSKFAPFATRNLGRSLGDRLRVATRARVVLHAQATRLEVDADGRVRAVELRTPAGGVLLVEAACVVLATGTVEVCRQLLLLRRSVGEGTAGQVGRGFGDHLTVEVATFAGVSRERAMTLFRPWIVGGLRGTLHGLKLEAGPALRRQLGIQAALAHVTFAEPENSGAAAVRAMLRARQRGEEAGSGVDWRGLPRALRDTWRLRQEAQRHGRRYISPEARVGLRVNVAQSAEGRSFVALSERTDAQGQTLARVHWEHGPDDLRSIRLFATYLRRHFDRAAFEGMQWHPETLPLASRSALPCLGAACWRGLERALPGLEDARHAMGGACMASDPRRSVVDLDLKVHGLRNLYVASAAVFPDGEPQLPSMTLMALTLRLGEHLARVLRQT